MPKFPEPSTAWIAEIGPELCTLDVERLWWRVYFSDGAHPATWDSFRSFGPVPTARFDHHLPPASLQSRQSFYAATHAGVCLAEVFQDRRRVHFDGKPRLTALRLRRSVEVLDLRGLWPTVAGSSQAVATGPRSRSQRWARAIADTFEVDGLIYRSSMHGGDDAIVLWDCPDVLPDAPEFDEPLSDPRFAAPLRRAGASIGYSVAEVEALA